MLNSEDTLNNYGIHFSVEQRLSASAEPAEYIVEIEGDIRAQSNAAAQESVGWLSARVVRAQRAVDDGESLFDVCDSVDQDLHESASAVYDYDRSGIKESISDDCIGIDILIVDSIQIIAGHRGKGLGHLAMRRAVDTFGHGCALVVIQPFPLQFSIPPDRVPRRVAGRDAKMGWQSLHRNKNVALARLRNYWKQMGFQRVGRTNYFVLDLQLKHPSHVELCSRKPADRPLVGG